MSVWRINRNADALYEGTVLFSTLAGTAQTPYNLAGATMTWKLGSAWGVPAIYTRSSVSSTNWAFGTAIGTWTFQISSEDSGSLAGSAYYFTLWLKNSAGKEYAIEIGTLQVMNTVGTV